MVAAKPPPPPLIYSVNPLDLALHHLALTQHGLITAADVTRLGVTSHGVRRRITTGQWQRLTAGVWRLTTQPRTWLQRLHAAQLALGPQAWLSHHTAAALHEFDGFGVDLSAPDGPVDVLVAWPQRSQRGPWTLHVMGPGQPPPVPNLEVERHQATGLLVTTPARTVLDLSTLGLSDGRLGDAIDSAVRMNRASPQFIGRLLARRTGSRHRGVAQLRSLLTDTGGTNRLERAMLAWLRTEGLPRPQTQRTLRTGGRPVARLDFRFTDVRVVLEVSGALGHSSLEARRRHAAMVHAAQHEGEYLVELMADEVFQRRPGALDAVLTARRDAYERRMFRPGFAPDPSRPFR